MELPSYQVNVDHPYINYKSIKYPKPGTQNPTVELHVVDLPVDGNGNENGENSYMLLPPTIIRQR